MRLQLTNVSMLITLWICLRIYCNMCGTVLRLCTGANVSWDGALAFIPADYVSSGEVRCNVPSLAMTMRLGKTWEPNDFRGIRSWMRDVTISVQIGDRWVCCFPMVTSEWKIKRHGKERLVLNPAELSAGIVHSCRGHMMTNRSLTAYLVAKKNTGYLMQAGTQTLSRIVRQ